MKTTRRPSLDSKIYEDYYLNQVGQGMPTFQGPNLQRGYGLGGILGGLLRSAMPLLKQGAKVLGKHALKTGVNIATDALAGQSLKAATKRRLQESGKTLGRQVVNRMRGGGRGRKQNKSIKRKRTSGPKVISRKRKIQRRSRDIFD